MPPRRARVKTEPSKAEQVANLIRSDIQAGRLRDGDVLPSGRELAVQFGTSENPVSEAMKILVAEGYVEAKPRSKRIVRVPGHTKHDPIQTVKPQVVLIGGYAGSGKTELGRVMAQETGWALIDKDTITRPVVELALEELGCSPHDRESSTYLSKVRPAEYEALAAVIQENLECEANIIVSAPHLKEFKDATWLTRMKATAASFGASLVVVWVYCDADTMHTYIRRRGAARDTAKLADWFGYLAGIDIDFRPATEYHLIDNSVSSDPLQDQAKKLVKAIRKSDEDN